MEPNCQHHHLRYNLNRCIAQLSSCNDSNVQQTGLAQHLLQLFCTILNFQTPFFKTSGISIFWSDSIENLYENSKRVETAWYEVSYGYAAVIQIYDLLKEVPSFWTTQYTVTPHLQSTGFINEGGLYSEACMQARRIIELHTYFFFPIQCNWKPMTSN